MGEIKVRYIILLCLFAGGLMFISSGCTSYEVTTWKNPDFKIRSYKKAFMKKNDEDSLRICSGVEDYLNHIGIETETYSKENIIQPKELVVELNTTWWLSRPHGHSAPIYFTYPKYVTVEFFDAITKKKLLKTTYNRDFWADISSEGCGNYPVIIIKNIDKTLGLDIVNQNYPNSGAGLR